MTWRPDLSPSFPATVLCFGEALWDMLPSGKKPGGAPMNVALRLARLGVPVRLLSRVGDDELGRELLAYLEGEGLATDFVQTDRRHPTGRVRVDASDPRAVRYDIEQPSAWDFIDAVESRVGSDHPGGDVVVFGSLVARGVVSRASLLEILVDARLSVFDVNLRPPFVDRGTIEGLLEQADWAKLNDRELERIGAWGGAPADAETAVRHLAERYGLDTVCVTLGEHGALMLHEGRVFREEGFRVPVVDTVGCGDSFLGAWLAGMLAEDGPQAVLRRACAIGALVATHAGANPEVREEDVRTLMAG